MKKITYLYTRFSLVNKSMKNGWNVSKGDTEQHIKNVIGDVARLKTRCDIFFGYTLPNIYSSVVSGLSVYHTVYASDLLPDWVKEKLKDAEIKYSFFRVRYVAYEEEFNIMNECRNEISCISKKSSSDVCYIIARLDDDDVLSPRFFECLQRYIAREYVGFSLSLPLGLIGVWNDDLKCYDYFAESDEPKIAIGLGFINYYESKSSSHLIKTNAPNVAHKRIEKQHPLILDSTFCDLYIRSLHENNDTYVERLKLDIRIPILDKTKEAEKVPFDRVCKSFTFPL